MVINTRESRGFSLLEIILYLGLAAIVGSGTFTVLSVLQQSRLKAQAVADVEAEGARLMQAITQSIRSSQAINSPVAAASAASVSLARSDGAANPTMFDVSNGNFRIAEGAGQAIQLSSSNVMISDVNFLNGTIAGARGLVRVRFTVSTRTGSTKNHYQYSQSFYDSAALR